MSRQISFTRGARSDFQRAFHWYEAREPGVGLDFLKQVDRLTETIAAHPFSYPKRHHDFRRAPVHKFPYAVYFRLDEEKIIVTAIVHGARSPEQTIRLLGRKF